MSHSCENHKNCVNDALSKAQMICDDHNISLTPLRKKVLKLVWQQGHTSVKAYDLLENLKKEEPSAKPVTIYRALDFLIENHIIHKIESQNSYIGCNHPTRQHNCAFLICNKCREITECCESDKLMSSIKENLPLSSFTPQNITLEVHGICKNCN